MKTKSIHHSQSRRKFFKLAFASIAAGSAGVYSLDTYGSQGKILSFDGEREPIKITKLETFKVKPRFLFLKVYTDQGITGLGEPITEGRADTCAAAIKEMEPYLLGKDARRVMHHWQAIYRHSFYRGGPILTSALSGLEQALWDIKGKALGVPIYELLGGPTRDRIRIYAHARTPESVRKAKAEGFTTFKTGVKNATQSGVIASERFIEEATEAFAALKDAAGKDGDVGIDFHGAISPNHISLSLLKNR
jgi:galactonate dehydratase